MDTRNSTVLAGDAALAHSGTSTVLVGLAFVLLVAIIVGMAGGIIAKFAEQTMAKAALIGSSAAATTTVIGLSALGLLLH